MYKFLLKSGKRIEIQLASVSQALNLLQTALYITSKNDLDLKDIFELPLRDLILKNSKALLNLMASPELIEAVEDCAKGCFYEKMPYSRDIFEDESRREDFLPCLFLIFLENLRPFFGKAPFMFNILEELILSP